MEVVYDKEDDPMDNNPKVTKALASTFMDNPIFEDIAEGIEPPQERAHYLPTTLPQPHVIWPVRINPIRACATTSQEETITAMTDATKLITNAIKTNRSLKGRVPEPFEGDQMKTQKFLNIFRLF
jgi:hypothetical protein